MLANRMNSSQAVYLPMYLQFLHLFITAEILKEGKLFSFLRKGYVNGVFLNGGRLIRTHFTTRSLIV